MSPSAPYAVLQAGGTIGPYRIVRSLGQGGMGTVYEVEHVHLGVRLALKTFTLAEGDRAFLRKRFIAEGRLLARIEHPRVVHVVDLGFDPATDTPYFVMNLVVGPEGRPQTLATLSAAGGLAEEKLLAWYDDVRAALAVVHAAGIVHRDIKPDNILVDATGRAVLADFGVCRIVDDALRARVNVTRTEAVGADAERQRVLGTAAYLSPEVLAGAAPTASDDFYALGVAFFRLLTGVWYAPGTSVMDLLLPFDPRWKKIFASLLAVDPARRCAPAPDAAASAPPARRPGRRLATVLAAGLLLAAGAAWFWCRARTPSGSTSLDDLLYIPACAR